MHLLAADIGRIDEGEQPVDLNHASADIVFLSAADSELAALAAAAGRRGSDGISFRFANLGRLGHPLSVDLYVDKTAGQAKLVIVRAMGGAGYWSYGLDRLRELARGGGPGLVVIPGEDRWDPALEAFTTVKGDAARRLWRYLVEGNAANCDHALQYVAHLIGAAELPPEPQIMPRAGCYWPGRGAVSIDKLRERFDTTHPSVAIVFYRAHLQGALTAPIDALCAALIEAGLNPIPIFVASLKERESRRFAETAFETLAPSLVLNCTAFALSSMGGAHEGTVLDRPGRPVLQVVLAATSEEAWFKSARGLSPRDLTMNVVLPEVDGRLLTRAVSFKAENKKSGVVEHCPRADRIAFVVEQTKAWIRLARTPVGERRVAIVLSNYPNRDGRIANGVGLDTPESAARLADTLRGAGYRLDGFPATAEALMAQLLAGPTNRISSSSALSECLLPKSHGEVLSLADYGAFFKSLPASIRHALTQRWGSPEQDPFVVDGGFQLGIHRFGNMVVGIQPSRGYDIDPKATYHDPDLAPPHRYLAFYAWLRGNFRVDAVAHLGKHGNLEWLPGKALGLSHGCWPEVALGATPLIYPFIVNDPGEGSQAKRRASAVIVDHLMPAMTRAEIHGPLAELETLIDEYYLATGVDPKRRDYLQEEIVAAAERHGLDRDLGIGREYGDEALQVLDAHLCELKEMQIRDGLHILGQVPAGRQRRDTLVAIARVPRSGGRAADASLHRAIATDLKLGEFDPLDCDLAATWRGPRPEGLLAVSDAPWRTNGDTVERIELLAAELVERGSSHACVMSGRDMGIEDVQDEENMAWIAGAAAGPVLDWIATELAPALDDSGCDEIAAVIAAFDGRFVVPGPSGAPTRGRPDVLPTGRNFYSVDTRAVPTAAAWALGRQSAEALALRYFQDEGEWPRSIAISAWGTSNMRTGGDDIAHVMALSGAKPVWESGTGRVTGFEVMPLAELGRPRIDVILRISGMFRDAFPAQIDLIDSAVRAIAALDEPEDANPIAAEARKLASRLEAAGADSTEAMRMARARVFGSKPGAYGAGLQALIDEGIWEDRKDFAKAFLAWGGFAYGGGASGDAAGDLLAERLAKVNAVFQAQDNREHDILDSDDYYQFEGGLAATVEALRGEAPRVYHGDTSRPEMPVVRSLGEEIARVVRGRAANPKWIQGVMRHGYKGAFEMAATVNYLFAFAATTDAVQDHHFDQLFDAYIADETVRSFIADNNQPALSEIAAQFREAIDRGLWSPRSNSAYDRLSSLIKGTKSEAAE